MPSLLSTAYRALLPLPILGRAAVAAAPRVRRWVHRPPALGVQVLEAHAAALAGLRDDVDRLSRSVAALEARVASLEAAAALPRPR